MPRTVEEILAHADEMAKRFEDYEPQPGDVKDAAPLRAVREAFEDAARAQSRLAERVSVARASGLSWASIGAMLGTSGEAARQRYGGQPPAEVAKADPAKAAPPAKAPTKDTPRAKAPAKAAPARAAKAPGKATTVKAAKGMSGKIKVDKSQGGRWQAHKGGQKSAERGRSRSGG